MDLPLAGRWARSRRATPTTTSPGDEETARADAAGRSTGAGADAPTTPRTADEAVRVLYGTHWHQLVRLATLLTRDASVAEEIVQDAFVSLHRRWSSLADPGAAHGYLRTTGVDNARSVLRHRGVEER